MSIANWANRPTDEEREAIEADNARNIEHHRVALANALTEATRAIGNAQTAVRALASNEVYDVEIAEGGTDRILAALMQADLDIAAAQHLTRNARPEGQS